MKAFKYSLGVAAALAVSVTAANAASLGAVEYDRFTNSLNPLHVDMGGAKAGVSDALIGLNQFNGASTLPNGLAANYTYNIDRTFIGDANPGTQNNMVDWYWFKLDPAAMGGAASVTAGASLTIALGPNADGGLAGLFFQMYETDAAGNPTGPYGAVVGEGGQIILGGFHTETTYVMRVTGWLVEDTAPGAADNSTDIGRYDIILGLNGIAPVPVPPAIALLLSAVGALFGFGSMRRRKVA